MQFTKNFENEQLSPIYLEPMLDARLKELKTLLAQKQKDLKKAPEGTLRVSESNKVVQYYHRTKNSGANGSYIPVKNLKLAKALAQKDYDKKIIAALKKELRVLQAASKAYEGFAKKSQLVEAVYEKCRKNRRALIKPVRLPDEQFAALWQSVEHERKAFPVEGPEYFTARGERVRSKSEIIIADTLNRLNIPYRYEFPISITVEDGTNRMFFPDFVCLNLRNRQEFIWEHFGIMDDAEYAANAVHKLFLYGKNGLHPGKNLIISFETAENPINARQVEKIAREYLS